MKKKIVIGITGTKTWENKNKIKDFMHKLRYQTDSNIVVVGLGDKDGADKYIKKYSLEFGYEYQEINPAHTNKNLYSVMAEAYYNKVYQAKNFFQQTKIFSEYVDKCVIFDNTATLDKKIVNLTTQLTKSKKTTIIISS